MRILFIHQNFPAQFKHLAPALARLGHEVCALTSQSTASNEWMKVKLIPYEVAVPPLSASHPLLSDLDIKLRRGEAVLQKAMQLRSQGYVPDIIIAHPAWGESLFVKEVWPRAKLGLYSEFFYNPIGQDVGFDPEFPTDALADSMRLRLKNLNQVLHFDMADAGISPTAWQASTFPESFRSKISVIHDGIDTRILAPNERVTLTLNDQVRLTVKDEIITFVNRNLEPYRGYHIFMRALPEILARRPNARVLIVGGNQVSYGAKPSEGTTWRSKYLNEIKSQLPAEALSRIHFFGKIPYQDYIALLQLSSLHVYLTYPFVLSWSLIEAMSVGCAILASDTAPVREVITQDQHGRLVNFFDVPDLADQACELLGNQEMRRHLGQHARAVAQERYDLHQVCLPQQLAWIDGLLKG